MKHSEGGVGPLRGRHRAPLSSEMSAVFSSKLTEELGIVASAVEREAAELIEQSPSRAIFSELATALVVRAPLPSSSIEPVNANCPVRYELSVIELSSWL